MTTTPEPEFDVEAYQAQHTPPSSIESTFLSMLMFGGLVIVALGCWFLTGWS